MNSETMQYLEMIRDLEMASYTRNNIIKNLSSEAARLGLVRTFEEPIKENVTEAKADLLGAIGGGAIVGVPLYIFGGGGW